MPRSALTRLAASSRGFPAASPATSSASGFPSVRLQGELKPAQSGLRTNLPAAGFPLLCTSSGGCWGLVGSAPLVTQAYRKAIHCCELYAFGDSQFLFPSTLLFILFPPFLGVGVSGFFCSQVPRASMMNFPAHLPSCFSPRPLSHWG